MRGMIFQALTKKLFGKNYERLKKALIIYLIVFMGLHTAGFRISVAPFILYLMTSTFTAGVMWRAMDSEDNAANMKNLFMLPFEGKNFIFSYVSALGAYTVLTKTAGLFAVVFALSSWKSAEIFGSLLCTINAVLMTAWVYSRKKYRGVGLLWAGIVTAEIFLLWDAAVFLPVTAGNALLAALLLSGADPYGFYRESSGSRSVRNGSGSVRSGGRTARGGSRCSVWRYLFRYFLFHKNYLTNTAVMWGAACVLPAFLGQTENLSVMPVGFALLTLNTPICILLSCDPALEQAVRFLPGQKRLFCVPYCLFIFLCNMTAEGIFLCSWQMQVGGVTGSAIFTAAFFALQSAVGSVMLEWFFPIRNWNMENDLWHHPRKYVVPAAMLLVAEMTAEILRNT